MHSREISDLSFLTNSGLFFMSLLLSCCCCYCFLYLVFTKHQLKPHDVTSLYTPAIFLPTTLSSVARWHSRHCFQNTIFATYCDMLSPIQNTPLLDGNILALFSHSLCHQFLCSPAIFSCAFYFYFTNST